MEKDYDIIVVGAGINGMTAASALSENGFKVALVERGNLKNKLANTRDGRGISIAKRSKEILQSYDIWKYISQEVGEMHRIRVMDGDARIRLEFDGESAQGEALGFLIESDRILKGLYNKIIENKVTLFAERECSGIEFSPTDATLILSNGDRLHSKVTIVTDGKNSHLRSMLGLHANEKKYHQVAFVFNVEHSEPHDNCAYECFFRSGPFALLPLYDSHKSSVVWCENEAVLNMSVDTKDIEMALKLRCKGIYQDVKIISEIAKFPLSASNMDQYYKERAVFIGDSLHFIHPVAGQGYNLSLRDIEALVGLFVKYRDLGFDIGCPGLFNEFFNVRKKENAILIHSMDELVSLFSDDSSVKQIFRRFGLDMLNNMSFMKRFFVKKAMGY